MSKFATLTKLVKKGESQKLSDILQQQPINVNEIDSKSGKALLHMAIENSDRQTFQVLVCQIGINLQQMTKDGEYPLQMAVRLNDVYLVSRLLDLKVNARRKNKEGETILHSAIRNQTHNQIIKKLTANIFDINQKIAQYGTFLNLSIEAGQPENFFFLIKQTQIKYNVTDQQDNTCLILAAKYNKGDFLVAILQKLEEDSTLNPIQKQFFINAQNKEGNTALHEACIRGYQTITQKLQTFGSRFGIDITIKNKKGQNVQLIKMMTQKNRLNQIQAENKRVIQKSMRKREKNQEKAKQRQQEERARIQQKRIAEQEQMRILLQAKIKKQTSKKKTLWTVGIIFIIVLSGMYLAIVNLIEKKKALQNS